MNLGEEDHLSTKDTTAVKSHEGNINGRQETHTDRSKLALMMDKHRVQCVAGTFNYKFNIMANLLHDNPHQGDGSNQVTSVSVTAPFIKG